MSITFDDGAADILIQAASNAATTLRDQGYPRRTAAENAAEDFSGGYATLFTTACATESQDRGTLAGVLDSLVTQVQEAKTKATEERNRQTALSSWQDREDQRDKSRLADPTGTAALDEQFTDPKPSTTEVAPPTISAAFAPKERTRSATGGGKSSADPAKLKGFVTQARASNTSLESEVITTQNAWAGFTGACSWVHIGSVTFASGFGRFVTENKADVVWIERVATQFEKAGSGSLKNTALNAAAKSPVLDIAAESKFNDLLNGKLTPAEAAEYWNSLGLSADDVKLLPDETLLKLASMDGLPAWAQDVASREFLQYALDHPKDAYDLMGFEEPEFINTGDGPAAQLGTDLTLTEFITQMTAIDAAFDKAVKDTKDYPGDPVSQLVGLGNHDGALVAGISIGDLDTATNVGVNVSGMNSNVGDMTNGNRAAQALYKDAAEKNKGASYAVVNWIGYRSPTATSVQKMAHADAGAKELSGFLNGINASRTELGLPIEQFNVYAHSYGTTVAVEALQLTDFKVDILAMYGSAGVKNGTTIDDLKNADKVYFTAAVGDNWAWAGQGGEKSLDPKDIEGTIRFSSRDKVDGDGNEFKETNMHGMYQDQDKDDWARPNIGYLQEGSTSLDRMGSMLGKGRAK